MDINARTVETINRGEVHIVEPDLDIVVRATVAEGFLTASTEPEPADVFLIAVQTPFKGENHDADLSYIEAASRSIAPVLASGNLVVLESTVPVGATEMVAATLAEARPDLTFPQSHGAASDIRIAHCPERVLPGRVMQELITNDRLIGGMTHRCAETAAELYGLFVVGERIIASSCRAAELAKLTENSFRDVNIAFANELSLVCDRLGVDVWELVSLANHHPRVNILQPGPGVGGHCIPVDPWFIVASAPQEARLIRTAREVNDAKPEHVVAKVREAIDRKAAARGTGKVTVACFGLTFKANINDLRHSPAIEIVRALSSDTRLRVLAVEPHIDHLPVDLDDGSVTLVDAETALAEAQVVVGLVAHTAFRQLDRHALAGTEVIDSCAIW